MKLEIGMKLEIWIVDFLIDVVVLILNKSHFV